MSKPPFQSFDENRIIAYIHDLRVYIGGADVTPYLTGSLGVSYADRDGTNTCSFTLSNHGRAFEITEDNLNRKYRLYDPSNAGAAGTPQGRTSEYAKYVIVKNKEKFNTVHAVKTFGPVQSSSTSNGTVLNSKGSTRSSATASSTTTKRYPFNVGSLVFHKYDPVRVFVRDPLNQQVGEAAAGGSDIWVNVFTGYVDLKPYTQDFTDGASYIKVSCQDIRMLMKNMRTQINPSVQVGNENTAFFTPSTQAVQDKPEAGFFNDLIKNDVHLNHVLGKLSWKDSVKFLLRGVEFTQGAVSTGQSANKPNKNLGAVGKLTDAASKGAVTVTYAPGKANSAKVLEDWNNLIIFGKNKRYLTNAEMIKLGTETREGGSATPDAALIHFLEPTGGTPPSNLIEFSNEAPTAGRAEWSSRLELLQSLCRSVDYQMYVTGSGDIVFEFPMYDFFPDHFNSVYNKLYTFEKHVVSDDINDEGGTPVSALLVTSRGLFQEVNKSNPNITGTTPVANSQELTRTIFSNVLASRIGVHVETHSVPGITSQERLTQYGMMEFIKRVSEFDKFALNIIYRPYIGVNRPIYYATKRRMGITHSVSYDWNIRGEVRTSVELGFVRKQEKNKDGSYSFRFITGGEATPISYSTIFAASEFAQGGVGVSATGGSGTQSTNKDSNSGSSGTGKIA